MRRLIVIAAFAAFAALAGAAPAVAQMQTSTTTTSVPGGSSSVTFGAPLSTPSSVSVITTPPPATVSPVIGGTTSAPVTARTGPYAPQEVALGLFVLMAGALVVKGMPKPGRHARGYRR